jgi:hypothetical protein
METRTLGEIENKDLPVFKDFRQGTSYVWCSKMSDENSYIQRNNGGGWLRDGRPDLTTRYADGF